MITPGFFTGTPPERVTFFGEPTALTPPYITATFATEGVYNFRVLIKIPVAAFITTNDVSITVPQIPTSVSVTNGNAVPNGSRCYMRPYAINSTERRCLMRSRG
jgi:hypothetical protein